MFGNMNQRDSVTALAALAQESRLAVFRLLVQRGPDGYSAGEISEQLAIPGPTLSFHLKELATAGLVAARRDGRFIYYSPSFERMRELVGFLTDNCCSLAARCAPECATPVATRRKRKSA
jgi:ArsR family transcriptional regulator, arsenate/arsenite/antimonite-responsive transcriptional repressor